MALFQDRFRPNLQHFAEYGLLLSPHRLALVTLGCGHAFGASVVRFLRDTGHRQIAVSQMDELQAALGSWMLVRCAYDRGGRSTTSLYFRQPLSLVSIGAFLKDYEVPECDLEGLKNLAGLLGTEHTGIVSVQFRRDAIPWFRVYLSAKAEAEVSLASKLRTAFGAFPTLDSSWNRFRSHVGEVYRGGSVQALVSLPMGSDRGQDHLKLDLFEVSYEPLDLMLNSMDLRAPKERSCAQIGQTIDSAYAEHVGVAIYPDHIGVSAYFVARRSY